MPEWYSSQISVSLALGFGSGHDFRVVGWSPVSCSMLGVESAWDSLPSLPLSLPHPQHALSLNK